MTARPSDIPDTLPVQLTSFVGREAEIAQARSLLHTTRLLTLTGPGGSGKTRLALAIAGDIQSGFADGVVFVSLAPITDPERVPSAIAAALRFALSSDRPPAEQLVDTFNARGALLLLLDNFEQVASAAPLVTELLAGCPRLTVLVTSRAPLRLSGEQVFLVPPLPLPDEHDRLATDEIMRNPAVTLFEMRAQLLDSSFRVTDGNARGVVDVCRRLDGLPLAIELAAARINVFSPRELADRLERRLPALAQGPRDAPRRQQTIHDAIAWSYHLLNEDQHCLFEYLSIFTGGWTLDAARAVVDGTNIDVLETLATLIDHSLVQVSTQSDGSTRYGMLETIREFGRERLIERGEDAPFARHAAYFTDLAERADRAGNTPEQVIWLSRLATEIHNLRIALAWSIDHDPVVTLRLAGALGMFWLTQALMREGGDWLESALARCPSAPLAIRAKALRRAGDLACWQGEYELAASMLEKALSFFREIGDEAGIGITLFGLARTAHFSGDFEPALSLYEQTIQLQEKLGNWYAVAGATGNSGNIYIRQGDLERGQQQVETALRLCREHGYPMQVAIWARQLGQLFLRHNGDQSRARELIIEALQIDAESSPLRIPENLEVVALLALGECQPDRAACLHGAAYRLRTLTGFPRNWEERQDLDADVVAIRSALGQEAFDAAWKAGEAMTVDEAIAEALREPYAPQPETAGVMKHLTNREREVLRLIVEGFSDKEVAERLSISPYTAMRHVGNILNKLGLPSRTAAATFAVRNGLI